MNSDGDGPNSLSDVYQKPGSDSASTGDDDLLSVFVGPESAHYYVPAFRRLAADGGVGWSWPAFFATLSWLLYRKMWFYSLAYLIGVPTLFTIMGLVAVRVLDIGTDVRIFLGLYFVIGFILAPLFATRIYYWHARKKIRKIKARAQSVEDQRLAIARVGGTGVISTVAAVLLPMIIISLFALAPSFLGHSQYTARAQVSEGLNLSGGVKAAVAEYYQIHKQLPLDNAAAGLPPAADINGKFVSSVRFEAGKIIVSFGDDSDSDISGRILVLRPEVSGEWLTFECSSPDIATKNLPSVCR